MTVHYADDKVAVHHGDCLEVLRGMPANSVDAVVTDPPAGIGFMGREWDHDKGGREQWSAWLAEVMREALRVAKPGAHAFVWALPRTSHWTACGLEDAGWVIRERVVHLFGTGFPKSLDVSKAIDKARNDGPDRLAVGRWLRMQREASGLKQKDVAAYWPSATGGLTGCVANWEGGLSCPTWEQWLDLKRIIGLSDDMDAEVWRLNGRKGTPGDAWERRPITQVEVRPSVPGTTISFDQRSSAERERRDIAATPEAEQWHGWGTALKPAAEDWWLARKPLVGTVAANVTAWGTGALNIAACRIGHDEPAGKPSTGMHGKAAGIMGRTVERHRETTAAASTAGRWPANVVLDDAAAEALDQMSGETGGSGPRMGPPGGSTFGGGEMRAEVGRWFGDAGGASRFFYTAKAGTDERITHNGTAHPTVKPLSLMRWLVRLVTPLVNSEGKPGLVLDPFAGSGTTLEAALLEGFRAVGIEREADYLPLITQRIHRRRDPVAYLTEGGHDLGLFDLDEGPAA